MTRKKRRNQQSEIDRRAVKRSEQEKAGKVIDQKNAQTANTQEKPSVFQKLHQNYGLPALLGVVVSAIIAGGINLYINGKMPFISVEKTSEAGKSNQLIDQNNQVSDQHNNYVINNLKTTNIQTNQTYQSFKRDEKKELYEAYLRNDTAGPVSYQFYDYEQQMWVVSTVQSKEENRILSTEPRVLFGLEDSTGNVYIFYTGKIATADVSLKANKITYNIKEINLNTIPSSQTQNYIDDNSMVWKVFSNAKEILPEPSLNILSNKTIFFEP